MSRHLAGFVAAARRRAETLPPATAGGGRPARRSLRRALGGRDRIDVIAEFKRASPSQGAIAEAADPAAHVRAAATAGAAALSVLTEPQFFGGSYDDLAAARAVADVPIVGKDFVVDLRQLAAAARCGADAVLLILRCLDDLDLSRLVAGARERDLEVVLECHDAAELERALAVPDAIVGVNNRDLDTLEVDIGRAARLLPLVPADRIAIAESGYRTAAEVQALRGLANAVLIGTSIMRGADLGALVAGGRTA